MTKDNVNLSLTSVIYYHITSPHKAAFGISNIRQALVERTQTTLRHVIGARVLQDVIERREEIAQSIREIIEETAAGWGAAVESMLVKDIIFSQDLQDSLSMAAQSKRTGEAKVISARAEVESAKLMRQAADILSSAPAMQIRYLEAMQQMAKQANSKVIFVSLTSNSHPRCIDSVTDTRTDALSSAGSRRRNAPPARPSRRRSKPAGLRRQPRPFYPSPALRRQPIQQPRFPERHPGWQCPEHLSWPLG